MQVQQNFSLKKYNSFGLHVFAKYFASFQSVTELEELSRQASGHQSSILVLGGGSNILFKSNFDGFILKNEIKGVEKTGEDDEFVYVKAGAGENWHQFVMYCINNNLAGVENLSLIPGNTGAGPMQNIGAYGVEIKDVFQELEAFDLREKAMVKFGLNDCAFGYRESFFKRTNKGRYVILSVTFKLSKTPRFSTGYGAIETELERMGVTQLSIRAVSQAVINIRTSKLPDPLVIGNAGSFFKNPEVSATNFTELKERFPGIIGYSLANGNAKLAAGWLIEQCGWKGYRRGDAGCHSRQALVLVNYGNASGDEIYKLSEEILISVEKMFGVVLEREVNVV